MQQHDGRRVAAGVGDEILHVGLFDREGAPGVEGKGDVAGDGQVARLPLGDPVQAAAKAGLAGIALEAGAGLVIDREEAVTLADRLGLFIYGIDLS